MKMDSSQVDVCGRIACIQSNHLLVECDGMLLVAGLLSLNRGDEQILHAGIIGYAGAAKLKHVRPRCVPLYALEIEEELPPYRINHGSIAAKCQACPCTYHRCFLQRIRHACDGLHSHDRVTYRRR